MPEITAGSCHCGLVSFQVTTPLDKVVACHCRQCRKQTGHFLAATRTLESGVSIKGAEHLSEYRASDEATRKFCSRCGSLLFWKSDKSENLSIMAGAFDEPNQLKLTHHIYCADKGDYYEITDGLPTFPADDG